VPTEAPNITAASHTSSTSLKITWSAVTSGLNGASLGGYVLFYKETQLKYSQNIQVKVPLDTLTAEVKGLKKYTNYTVRVLAYTVNGNGVASQPIVIATDEDGMYMVLLFC